MYVVSKKIFFVVVLFALSVWTVSAQIRDYICIVRPVYSDQTLAMMDSLSGQVARAGYQSLSDFIKRGGNQIFGSGFVANAPDGTIVVITNHHVVLDAESAILQFEAADGSITEYKNCPVIAIDDELDLAIIRLPADFPLKKGLTISSAGIRDGADVWSAGYPGLRGDPVWQLGKGTITNSAARISRLVDPQITTLLQHSAPVDSGNSGGPLLVENRNATAGYEVVGVNTWKIFFRQATNFATPAPSLTTFVRRGLAGAASETTSEMLHKRATSFAAVTAIRNFDDRNERIRKMSRYLALEYIHEYASEALLAVLSTAPSVVRSEVLDTLSGSATLAGLRLACAWWFDLKLQGLGESYSLGAPSISPGKDQDLTKVDFPVSDVENITIGWIREKEYWQVRSASFDNLPSAGGVVGNSKNNPYESKTTSGATSAFSIEQPYIFLFFVEHAFTGDISMYGGGAMISLARFLAFGGLFSVREINHEVYDWYFKTSVEKTTPTQGLGILVRGQIPVALNRFKVVPYIEGRGGIVTAMGFHEGFDSGLYRVLCGGVQIIFGDSIKVFLSPSWQRYLGTDNKKFDSLVISAGFGF